MLKSLKLFVFFLLCVVTPSIVTPLFAQQKPSSDGAKRCEKFYRGADGKIIRQTVPCPSSK